MKSAVVRGVGIGRWWLLVLLVVSGLAGPLAVPLPGTNQPGAGPAVEVIVQAASPEAAAEAVRRAGGLVTSELRLISAVSALVPQAALAALRQQPAVQRLWPNGVVAANAPAAGGPAPDTAYPRVIGAPGVWAAGITGRGVGVAIIDTGALAHLPALARDTHNRKRIAAFYDAIAGRQITSQVYPRDVYGHGSLVAGVIASSDVSALGQYAGVAPDAHLIIVRALGDQGQGHYADVIRGLDWVVSHRHQYNIRVLNLSFSAPPNSYYWDDPLNQAVMRAWQAGIVVVAAAGNGGPEPLSIGVPANVPYVLTVGAFTDHFTPDFHEDDYLPAFSATGPTIEGFIKPEVLAPGGHNASTLLNSATLAREHPEGRVADQYFQMTGTSMAAAVASGAAALILQHNPSLTPDEVKFRLMGSARPAVEAGGTLAYSLFQQGAGRINVFDAVFGGVKGTANAGLDIDADLNGTAHFGGLADRDAAGNYFVREHAGYAWDGTHAGTQGYAWSTGYIWSTGYAWSTALAFNAGYAWSTAYVWDEGYAWSTAQAAIDGWMPPE